MVSNPPRGQLNKIKLNYSLSPYDVSEKSAPLRLFSSVCLNQMLTHGVPPAFHDGVYLHHQPALGQSQAYGVTHKFLKAYSTDGVHE